MTALGRTLKSLSLPSLWIIYPVPWSLETLATLHSDIRCGGSWEPSSFSIQVLRQFFSGCGSW